VVSCAIFSSFSALKIKHRQQPPDPAVAVLEGVDLLKFRVEGDDVL